MNELNLIEILKEYSQLPEYIGINLDTVNTVSLFGDYPINIAATRGDLNEIKLLLKFGANINTKGEHGYSPLHNAVEQGYIDIVQFLVERGANKNILNDDGISPLSLLLKEEKIAQFLESI